MTKSRWAENRALGNTTRGRMKGREVVITFNTNGAMSKTYYGTLI